MCLSFADEMSYSWRDLHHVQSYNKQPYSFYSGLHNEVSGSLFKEAITLQ